MRYIAPEIELIITSEFDIATSGDLGVITDPNKPEPDVDWDDILSP